MFHFRHYQRSGGRGGTWVALVLVRTAAKNGIKGMAPGSAPLSPPQITDRITWLAEIFSPFSPQCEVWATEAIHYFHQTIMHLVNPPPAPTTNYFCIPIEYLSVTS